jgi:hypothetical protein
MENVHRTKKVRRTFKTDQERIIASRETLDKYQRKRWKCEECQIDMRISSKYNHMKIPEHINNVSQKVYDNFLVIYKSKTELDSDDIKKIVGCRGIITENLKTMLKFNNPNLRTMHHRLLDSLDLLMDNYMKKH